MEDPIMNKRKNFLKINITSRLNNEKYFVSLRKKKRQNIFRQKRKYFMNLLDSDNQSSCTDESYDSTSSPLALINLNRIEGINKFTESLSKLQQDYESQTEYEPNFDIKFCKDLINLLKSINSSAKEENASSIEKAVNLFCDSKIYRLLYDICERLVSQNTYNQSSTNQQDNAKEICEEIVMVFYYICKVHNHSEQFGQILEEIQCNELIINFIDFCFCYKQYEDINEKLLCICIFLCDHSQFKNKFEVKDRCTCSQFSMPNDSLFKQNLSIFSSVGFFNALRADLDIQEITSDYYKEVENLLYCCSNVIYSQPLANIEGTLKNILDVIRELSKYMCNISTLFNRKCLKIVISCLNHRDKKIISKSLDAIEEITRYSNESFGEMIIEEKVLCQLEILYTKLTENPKEYEYYEEKIIKILKNISKIDTYCCHCILFPYNSTLDSSGRKLFIQVMKRNSQNLNSDCLELIYNLL